MSHSKRSSFFAKTAVYLTVLSLLLVAFLFRWQHLLARIFHIDEFISMLAIQMTAQKGAPVLPSGVLYTHGLILSYFAAPFSQLSGRLSEEMMRWPSLLAGVAMVAFYYTAGRRLFGSEIAGLAACAVAAMDNLTVVWSARARMYSLAAVFVLLMIYFIVWGTLLHPRLSARVAAGLCFLAATAAHAVSVVLLPPLLLSLAVVLWLGRDRVNWKALAQPSLWLQLLLIGGLLLLTLGFGLASQFPFLSPSAAVAEGKVGIELMEVLGKFLEPGVSWQRVDDYIYYYTDPSTWLLTALAGLAIAMAVAASVRRRHAVRRRDMVTLFLGLLFLLTLAQLSLLLPSTWRKSRYLFILCQTPLFLLAADGISRLAHLALGVLKRPSRTWQAATGLLVVALLILWQRGAFQAFLGDHGVGGYDTAFHWVEKHWQPGDRIMTVHPSAAYLYLGRSNYYAVQSQARVVAGEENEGLVDRYVGSHLVETVDDLNRILASERDHVWFVVDNVRLFKRYEPYFNQQVFAQMELVHETGGVSVFRGRPFPRSLPEEPANPMATSFDGKIRLEGSAFDTTAAAPDGSRQLVLFWRLENAWSGPPAKVFVQLRDSDNNTVAQADHFIWDGLLTQSALKEMGSWDNSLRDSVSLSVPPDLSTGRYRLLVGLYNLDTFDRVPVVDDQTGENAAVIEEFVLP